MWALWLGVAVLVTLTLGVWWLRRSYIQVTIDGRSMEPTYSDGTVVVMRRVRSGRVKVGDVVAVAPPRINAPPPQSTDATPSPSQNGRLWIVKRVAAAPGDPIPSGLGPALVDSAEQPVPVGYLILLGDNPGFSHDSRQEGLIELGRLRAVAFR